MTFTAVHSCRGPVPLMRFMVGYSSAEIVGAILRVIYPDAHTALDLTPGHRCFWSEVVPTHVSVHFSEHDFTVLPYADSSHDVPLLDPPHLGGGGKKSIMAARYGTFKDADVEPNMRAGCREAWRVARIGVIVKVTDHVHTSKFWRESGLVIDELGEPYEVVHQLHSPMGALTGDPPMSALNNGSTYLIFRKGSRRHVRRTTA